MTDPFDILTLAIVGAIWAACAVVVGWSFVVDMAQSWRSYRKRKRATVLERRIVREFEQQRLAREKLEWK